MSDDDDWLVRLIRDTPPLSDEQVEESNRRLASMTEDEQRVMACHLGLGDRPAVMEFEEIAEAMGVPVEEVTQMWDRAMMKFRTGISVVPDVLDPACSPPG